MSTSVTPVAAPVVSAPVPPAAPVSGSEAVPVAAPLGVTEEARSKNAGWRDKIDGISKRNNGKPRLSPADTADGVANGTVIAPVIDPITGADNTPVAGTVPPAAPPSAPVTEIVSEDGTLSLRARDAQTGQFAEMDKGRTYELSVRDKQTGETKVYQKDLEGLMRLAKDGIGTQRLQDEVGRGSKELTYYREQLPKWKQEHEIAVKESGDFKALAVQLLTASEDQVVRLREQYATENSPDKVRQRDALSLEQERRAIQQERINMQVNQQKAQVGSVIGPIIQRVEAMVGGDAAAGKLLRETGPLMVNGVIPPERFQQLVDYVAGPYQTWAQSVAAEQAKSTERMQQVDAEKRRLQQATQLAVNTASAVARPVGSAGSDVAPKGRPKNINQAIDNIIKSRPSPSLTGSQSG